VDLYSALCEKTPLMLFMNYYFENSRVFHDHLKLSLLMSGTRRSTDPGQVILCYMPRSPSCTIWYLPTGDDALRLGRWRQSTAGIIINLTASWLPKEQDQL